MSTIDISYTDYNGNTGNVILDISNDFRELKTPEDLYALMHTDDFLDWSGNNYKIINNLDMSEFIDNSFALSPIGRDAINYFYGNIDGNNKKISNYTIVDPSSILFYGGLFGQFSIQTTDTFYIRNLEIEINGNIEMLFNQTKSTTVGGFIGFAIENTGELIIQNCSISGNGSLLANYRVGGIVGTGSNIRIENCKNNIIGNVEGGFQVGGIIGGGASGDYINCINNIVGNIFCRDVNNGLIASTGSRCGGIVGEGATSTTIGCINNMKGNIHAHSILGGIVGLGTACNIYNCINNQIGDIVCFDFSTNEIAFDKNNRNAGGILGANSNADIYNCITNQIGKIEGYEYIGGLVGRINDDCVINKCISNFIGDISGVGYIGGFIGIVDDVILSTVECCVVNSFSNVYGISLELVDSFIGGVSGVDISTSGNFLNNSLITVNGNNQTDVSYVTLFNDNRNYYGIGGPFNCYIDSCETILPWVKVSNVVQPILMGNIYIDMSNIDLQPTSPPQYSRNKENIMYSLINVPEYSIYTQNTICEDILCKCILDCDNIYVHIISYNEVYTNVNNTISVGGPNKDNCNIGTRAKQTTAVIIRNPIIKEVLNTVAYGQYVINDKATMGDYKSYLLRKKLRKTTIVYK
tara:strand:+ start:3173 stop:5086 length:1914 start_codon:yes stop_codon:yes gene_type:complete